jgi:hypothetical protein
MMRIIERGRPMAQNPPHLETRAAITVDATPLPPGSQAINLSMSLH